MFNNKIVMYISYRTLVERYIVVNKFVWLGTNEKQQIKNGIL